MNTERFNQLTVEQQKLDDTPEYEDEADAGSIELSKDKGKGENEELNENEIIKQADQKTTLAEVKTAEFITNGDQQMTEVEQIVDLPQEDLASVREEIRLTQRLDTIKTAAHNSLGKLKEKLKSLLGSKEVSDNATQKNADPEYQKLREQLKREREISRPLIEEARRKRDEILEARTELPLSQWDFDTYFGDKQFDTSSELSQQNVGICYLDAAINAMSRSPHFEIICRSSMERGRDGTWRVRLPLLNENGETVTITPEELLPQKNKKFAPFRTRVLFPEDSRSELHPAKGKEGLRALEAACIKARFHSVDQLAAEGGFPVETLMQLGGDNFKKYNLTAAQFNKEEKKWEPSILSSLEDKRMAYLDHYLENFDPEVHIATVGSKIIKGSYKVFGTTESITGKHAYSISNVDQKNKRIILTDPRYPSKPIDLTFDQLKENFHSFQAIRIDSNKLLNNMRDAREQAA